VNTEEVLFIFKPDSLMIWNVDVTQAMALEMTADKNSFFSYECDMEKTISIKPSDALNTLNRFEEGEFLNLFIAENGNEVRASIVKRDQKTISRIRQFSFPIMTPVMQFHDFKIDHENIVKLTSMLWKTAVMDMGVGNKEYTGGFLIYVAKDRIRFQKSSDINEQGNTKVKVEYLKRELREITIFEDNITVDLSLSYIYKFFKTLTDDLLLEFRFKKNKPFICRFEMSDSKLSTLSSNSPFKFKLLFAPYIAKEDFKQEDIEDTDGFRAGDSVDVPILDEIEDKNKIKEMKKEEGLKLE
jgi:hypothetical protein